MESQPELIYPSAGDVRHELSPFLARRCFLGLVKFELEKLKFSLELRIVVGLLSCCSCILEVVFLFFLLREIIVIVENAAIVEGLLRDDDFSLNKRALNILSQLF